MLLSKQKGVFRVNCIDCLDRTNVVQVCVSTPCAYCTQEPCKSAFARHVLDRQLEAVGLTIKPQSGRSGVDIVFNDGLSQFVNHRASGLINQQFGLITVTLLVVRSESI